MEKNLEYYMALPYTIEMQQNEEDGWFVRVRELRGCMSHGDTAEEAATMIREAMELWLEVSLDRGLPIPEPRPKDDYSGKFVVRVPRSLHRELVEAAEEEGVSLNQYINVALSRSVGRPITAKAGDPEEPCWSMLNGGVRQALAAAGLQQDAGEVDEQLFAGRVESQLEQVRVAMDSGYYRDANWALEELSSFLYPAAKKSPALALFYRTVKLLHEQIEPIARRQQGVIDERMLAPRIVQLVEGSTLAHSIIREATARYSAESRQASAIERESLDARMFSALEKVREKRATAPGP